jgi:Tol biopolymer transport system component
MVPQKAGQPCCLLSERAESEWDLWAEASAWLPAWLPEGRSFLFVATREGQPNLWRMSVDGSERVLLTTDGAFGATVAARTGEIVYTSLQGQREEVWRMEPDGRDACPLVP